MSIVLGNQLSNVAAQTTLDLQGIITSMRSSGMTDSAISATLMSDLTTGGRIFGNYRNQVKNTVKSGVSMAGSNGSEGRFLDKGVKEFQWVTVSAKPCPDCERRLGETGTMEYWRTVGKPQSGFSVCQQNCQCQLIAADYNGENLDKPLVRGAKPKKVPLPPTKINTKKLIEENDWVEDFVRVTLKTAPEETVINLLSSDFTRLEATALLKHIKKIDEDMYRYMKKEPKFLSSYQKNVDKWIRAVEVEGRIDAAYYFEEYRDVRDYLHAELIDSLRERGHKIRNLESFRKSTHKLYRVGDTMGGYNSFFMDKGQAMSYMKRFGVDEIAEYEVRGLHIIPTQSGASEVFVANENIISQKWLDL